MPGIQRCTYFDTIVRGSKDMDDTNLGGGVLLLL